MGSSVYFLIMVTTSKHKQTDVHYDKSVKNVIEVFQNLLSKEMNFGILCMLGLLN
jgi:hypothetical protein